MIPKVSSSRRAFGSRNSKTQMEAPSIRTEMTLSTVGIVPCLRNGHAQSIETSAASAVPQSVTRHWQMNTLTYPGVGYDVSRSCEAIPRAASAFESASATGRSSGGVKRISLVVTP